MKFEIDSRNVRIVADTIEIGDSVIFGKDVDVNIRGKFSIGDSSILGPNTQIRGNNISFGKHLFNSGGLRIGGGGRLHPNANFSIGDRCTIHNNFINVCEDVKIGSDVGFSPETSILTHGYWLSVFEGYPASFAPVSIGDGVIIGYRSLVMMGVEIAPYSVIGAQSVVTKSIKTKGIYAGSPAKFIRGIEPLAIERRICVLQDIIDRYCEIARYHGLDPTIHTDYPFVSIDDFRVNVETFEYSGIETCVTDDFRDYIRKWGIRIYTNRPFLSVFPQLDS